MEAVSGQKPYNHSKSIRLFFANDNRFSHVSPKTGRAPPNTPPSASHLSCTCALLQRGAHTGGDTCPPAPPRQRRNTRAPRRKRFGRAFPWPPRQISPGRSPPPATGTGRGGRRAGKTSPASHAGKTLWRHADPEPSQPCRPRRATPAFPGLDTAQGGGYLMASIRGAPPLSPVQPHTQATGVFRPRAPHHPAAWGRPGPHRGRPAG